MIALDTNVLVRFLIQDNKQQAKAVLTHFAEYEKNKQSFFITQLVILELIWVLEAVYEVTREDILHSLSELLLMPVLTFEAQSTLRSFITSATKSTFDLADLLIAHSAIEQGCDTTYTFDKKASKFEFFKKI